MERFEVCMTYFRGTGWLQGLVMKPRASHLSSTGLNPSTISICRWFSCVPALSPRAWLSHQRAQEFRGRGSSSPFHFWDPQDKQSPRCPHCLSVCPSVCLPTKRALCSQPRLHPQPNGVGSLLPLPRAPLRSSNSAHLSKNSGKNSNMQQH